VILNGTPDRSVSRRLVDLEGHEQTLPERGLVISAKLAEVLGVRAGETVTVDVREGRRQTLELPVAGTVADTFRLQAYAKSRYVAEVLGSEPSATTILLRLDPDQYPRLHARLVSTPGVLGVTRLSEMVAMFRRQSAEQMSVTTLILTVIASIIAVGVVYNNARVALSTRERDLASLRVLGMTRTEISAILLGELAAQVALAIPPGLWLGTLFSEAVASTIDPERFRLPLTISPGTYAYAAWVALASGVASALLVRRKLDTLDLIAVLKTRE
jgi:putative ABC transport system permease protein